MCFDRPLHFPGPSHGPSHWGRGVCRLAESQPRTGVFGSGTPFTELGRSSFASIGLTCFHFPCWCEGNLSLLTTVFLFLCQGGERKQKWKQLPSHLVWASRSFTRLSRDQAVARSGRGTFPCWTRRRRRGREVPIGVLFSLIQNRWGSLV